MKKISFIMIALLSMTGMAFADSDGMSVKSISAIDEHGNAIASSEIRSIVIYSPGTQTAMTIYDRSRAAITNPVLSTNANLINGNVTFWSGSPTFDVVIKTTTSGVTARNLNGSDTRIVVPKSQSFIVTKRFTIGSVGDTGTDMVFTTAANTSEQVVNTGAAIPLFARVLNISLINTEAAVFSGGGTTLVAEIGSASSGAQYAASATIYALNAIVSVADVNATGYPAAASASAGTIYVAATPGANWSTMTAGQWTLIVTYLDVDAYR
ncbi:MAG: hypothetical protein Q7T18_06740 [Sedimentisphaerales bacterium]|nr:hypothetical protein [Sedimentisphaerales bacterium]